MILRCTSLGETSSKRRWCREGRCRRTLPSRSLGVTECDKFSRGSLFPSRRLQRWRLFRKGTRIYATRVVCLTRRLQRACSTPDDTPSIAESTPTAQDPSDQSDPASQGNHSGEDGSPANGGGVKKWSDLVPLKWRSFWSISASSQYLRDSFGLLWRNLWTLMSLTALNSAVRFVLVWTLYKTVCAVGVHLLGMSAESIPQEMIPTSGATGDPNVYQHLADITFLIFKPVDFLFKGIFLAAGLTTCWDSYQPTTTKSDDTGRLRFLKPVWKGFLASFTTAWAALRSCPRYMLLYCIMSGMTVFYQGLCLLIIPIVFATKKILNLQLSLCISLFQGKNWWESLRESEEMVDPVRRHLYLPYLFLFLTPKLLGVLRDFVVKVFPDRLFVDVPEVTWGLIAITTVTAFLIDRMAEIFPIVIYSSVQTQRKEVQN